MVGLVSKTFHSLRDTENFIRTEVANLTKILNGPQGNVASKTAASIEMLNGLENLQQGSELYWYDALNLLGCMALAVGNIHSVTHHKDQLFTVVDYVRNFGNAAKKSLKRATHWAAYYFTNPNAWYPVPERVMIL